MKVSTCQMTPITSDKKSNMEKMTRFIQEAASEGSDLIVFPELVLTGYNCGDDFFNQAETIPGKASDYFAEIAKEENIFIIWGMPEEGAEGVLYNAAVLVGPEGYIGKWRKNYLPGHATDTGGDGAFPDRRFFKTGQELQVFQTKIGKIACLICYDIFFPELARLMTLKGADLLVGISGSPKFEKEIFEPIVKVRAMENTIPFLYTNLVGKEGATEYWGGSCVYEAGDVELKVPGYPMISKSSYDKEEIQTVAINMDKKGIRQFFPVLRDLDEKVYLQLLNTVKNY
ncbi:carbon-nitrogen hydrolase family protein [Streptococcus uberis]|uniref:carbon-nitrogen hydrolase family protein n=1 Tax=Streptococcus uberis TaxID=1349 RepID=UPI0027DAD868|nr:carbon-nitrogen hydrolase family protein [Streptococcus uberis]MCK1193057.1 carbon-nitrogen hydrolase family protein [Streptococcus uberis]